MLRNLVVFILKVRIFCKEDWGQCTLKSHLAVPPTAAQNSSARIFHLLSDLSLLCSLLQRLLFDYIYQTTYFPRLGSLETDPEMGICVYMRYRENDIWRNQKGSQGERWKMGRSNRQIWFGVKSSFSMIPWGRSGVLIVTQGLIQPETKGLSFVVLLQSVLGHWLLDTSSHPRKCSWEGCLWQKCLQQVGDEHTTQIVERDFRGLGYKLNISIKVLFSCHCF